MDPTMKIVTCIPLVELWDSEGLLDARWVRYVAETDIVALLQDGASFVIAEAGEALRWISTGDRFAFWKAEVRSRLVAPNAGGFYLDDYRGQYCYVAALWHDSPSGSVIVLEKHH